MLWYLLPVLFLAFCFALYRIVVSPELKYHSFLYKAKAWLVFNVGHIRRLDHLPYFTVYGYDDHKVSHRDAREASHVARPGDIGLHRDEGFVSNLAIPGGFKHAWLFVHGHDCVEAVSDGVIRRDCLAPLLSDYAIILRPIGTNKIEVDTTLARAESLVGCEYDANFNFPLDQFDEEYKNYLSHLSSGFHKAFSCTELVAFSWYHAKSKVGIFRSEHAGRAAVIADDFLRMNFGIIWMSPSVTLEWADSVGMHPESRQRIKDYLDGKRDFNAYGNPVPRR